MNKLLVTRVTHHTLGKNEMAILSEKMTFFIFLLEQYAAANSVTADQVLRQWDELGLSQLIYDMYERYHVETLENAFADIKLLVTKKRAALNVKSEKTQ